MQKIALLGILLVTLSAHVWPTLFYVISIFAHLFIKI